MSWKEELAKELTAEKIKPIKISYYGGVRVSFQNGMDFYIGGRWMEDGEYDDEGNQTNVCRINVFKKKGAIGFDSLKYREKMLHEHPDYFKCHSLAIRPEIEDMVADAVIEYFENAPEDYKGIKIIYIDYVKGQNKQQDKAESQQMNSKQLDEQLKVQSNEHTKEGNAKTLSATESNSDNSEKKVDSSLSSSNGMGKQP